MRILISFLLIICLTSCLTKETGSNADKAFFKMQLGVSYLEKNELPLALKELLDAEQLDPSNPLIHNNLGLVYFLRKKTDLAVKYFSKAVSLKPDFTEAKNNLARVYIEIKQYKNAEKLLNEVLEDLTYINAPAAYMNYGMMRFNQKRYAEAKVYFRKILQTSREDCYANSYYGRSFLELNELNDAAEQLDKAALYCKPLNIDEGHYYGAIAYYRLGKRDKAVARFEEVVQTFTDSYNKKNSEQMLLLIKKGPR